MDNGELKNFRVQSFSIINYKIINWKPTFSNPHMQVYQMASRMSCMSRLAILLAVVSNDFRHKCE